MPFRQHRIPIGKRREKVTIQSAVVSDDGMGGQTIDKWRTVGEPYAEVQALDERAKEALIAGQITGRTAFHVVIPYASWPSTTQELRMIVRNTTMEIHSNVDDEGRRRRRFVYVCEIQR